MAEAVRKIHTVTTKVTPPFGDEFQIAATLPLEKPIFNASNRIPITIHLSKTGTNTELGCYVYTILDKRSGRTHQTLLNNSNETLVDMTKKIGALLSKKYHVPTYVSVSGNWSLEDLLATIKSVVAFINESY
ncbi:hypothetical protein CAS74_001224 [Pichia kudriavzevii]|uniref:Uncharacterized protein n=1 Tax=Pichia kudriavzevii TaxID=4909 RepID=A0A099NXK7_PICKU|nr:uncharacterized protein C5L36_0A00350 [Pichia kudriavzevii]AWU73423.1 hypothetical protein C5L36_0A00350 [Pichia kudriavzevii]KGK36672.1 hypothetical protein JL09_g4160 [Pichia kudriavzevii]ONH72701.1 hypothetical protein BOH78_3627 [Pichia kudriavzevii]OUT22923.1 hypothetical protein CAS74_001224 [Pichia kudriavzevii]